MIKDKIKAIYAYYKKGKKQQALREFVEQYIKFEMRCDRGQRLSDILTRPIEAIIFKGGFIVGWVELIAYKTEISIPMWFWGVTLPVLYVIQKMTEYHIGRFDQKKLKSWEIAVDWENKHISTWEKEKMDILRKLNKKL